MTVTVQGTRQIFQMEPCSIDKLIQSHIYSLSELKYSTFSNKKGLDYIIVLESTRSSTRTRSCVESMEWEKGKQCMCQNEALLG